MLDSSPPPSSMPPMPRTMPPSPCASWRTPPGPGAREPDRRHGEAPGRGDPGQAAASAASRRCCANTRSPPRRGLALMVLAEALLRVPDAATADRLIEDKLGRATSPPTRRSRTRSWSPPPPGRSASRPASSSRARRRRASSASLAKRLGLPAVRAATRQAMRVMGNHFVLGQTIEDALDRARSGQGRLYRYSFDMLGEGARTADDAERYFESYAAAIEAIGRSAGNEPLPNRPGISVKLSALHPRYEALSRERVMRRARAARRRSRPRKARPTTSTSRSMPRRRTGSSCRST